MPWNFSFVLEGRLAGMAAPDRSRGGLRRVVSYLVEHGFGGIVSLTMRGLDERIVREAGLCSSHIPVVDFTAPSLEQMVALVAFVNKVAQQQRPTVIHCGAGIGRTGTALACYLVSDGAAPDAAMERIRELRPGSIETEDQEALVRRYGEWLSAHPEAAKLNNSAAARFRSEE